MLLPFATLLLLFLQVVLGRNLTPEHQYTKVLENVSSEADIEITSASSVLSSEESNVERISNGSRIKRDYFGNDPYAERHKDTRLLWERRTAREPSRLPLNADEDKKPVSAGDGWSFWKLYNKLNTESQDKRLAEHQYNKQHEHKDNRKMHSGHNDIDLLLRKGKRKSDEDSDDTGETHENGTEESDESDRTDESEDKTNETEESDSTEISEFLGNYNIFNIKKVKTSRVYGKKYVERCPTTGIFPDLKSCQKFYECSKNKIIFYKCKKKSMIYNPILKTCFNSNDKHCKTFNCAKKRDRRVPYEQNPKIFVRCHGNSPKEIYICPKDKIFVELSQECKNPPIQVVRPATPPTPLHYWPLIPSWNPPNNISYQNEGSQETTVLSEDQTEHHDQGMLNYPTTQQELRTTVTPTPNLSSFPKDNTSDAETSTSRSVKLDVTESTTSMYTNLSEITSLPTTRKDLKYQGNYGETFSNPGGWGLTSGSKESTPYMENYPSRNYEDLESIYYDTEPVPLEIDRQKSKNSTSHENLATTLLPVNHSQPMDLLHNLTGLPQQPHIGNRNQRNISEASDINSTTVDTTLLTAQATVISTTLPTKNWESSTVSSTAPPTKNWESSTVSSTVLPTKNWESSTDSSTALPTKNWEISTVSSTAFPTKDWESSTVSSTLDVGTKQEKNITPLTISDLNSSVVNSTNLNYDFSTSILNESTDSSVSDLSSDKHKVTNYLPERITKDSTLTQTTLRPTYKNINKTDHLGTTTHSNSPEINAFDASIAAGNETNAKTTESITKSNVSVSTPVMESPTTVLGDSSNTLGSNKKPNGVETTTSSYGNGKSHTQTTSSLNLNSSFTVPIGLNGNGTNRSTDIATNQYETSTLSTTSTNQSADKIGKSAVTTPSNNLTTSEMDSTVLPIRNVTSNSLVEDEVAENRLNNSMLPKNSNSTSYLSSSMIPIETSTSLTFNSNSNVQQSTLLEKNFTVNPSDLSVFEHSTQSPSIEEQMGSSRENILSVTPHWTILNNVSLDVISNKPTNQMDLQIKTSTPSDLKSTKFDNSSNTDVMSFGKLNKTECLNCTHPSQDNDKTNKSNESQYGISYSTSGDIFDDFSSTGSSTNKKVNNSSVPTIDPNRTSIANIEFQSNMTTPNIPTLFERNLTTSDKHDNANSDNSSTTVPIGLTEPTKPQNYENISDKTTSGVETSTVIIPSSIVNNMNNKKTSGTPIDLWNNTGNTEKLLDHRTMMEVSNALNLHTTAINVKSSPDDLFTSSVPLNVNSMSAQANNSSGDGANGQIGDISETTAPVTTPSRSQIVDQNNDIKNESYAGQQVTPPMPDDTNITTPKPFLVTEAYLPTTNLAEVSHLQEGIQNLTKKILTSTTEAITPLFNSSGVMDITNETNHMIMEPKNSSLTPDLIGNDVKSTFHSNKTEVEQNKKMSMLSRTTRALSTPLPNTMKPSSETVNNPISGDLKTTETSDVNSASTSEILIFPNTTRKKVEFHPQNITSKSSVPSTSTISYTDYKTESITSNNNLTNSTNINYSTPEYATDSPFVNSNAIGNNSNDQLVTMAPLSTDDSSNCSFNLNVSGSCSDKLLIASAQPKVEVEENKNATNNVSTDSSERSVGADKPEYNSSGKYEYQSSVTNGNKTTTMFKNYTRISNPTRASINHFTKAPVRSTTQMDPSGYQNKSGIDLSTNNLEVTSSPQTSSQESNFSLTNEPENTNMPENIPHIASGSQKETNIEITTSKIDSNSNNLASKPNLTNFSETTNDPSVNNIVSRTTVIVPSLETFMTKNSVAASTKLEERIFSNETSATLNVSTITDLPKSNIEVTDSIKDEEFRSSTGSTVPDLLTSQAPPTSAKSSLVSTTTEFNPKTSNGTFYTSNVSGITDFPVSNVNKTNSTEHENVTIILPFYENQFKNITSETTTISSLNGTGSTSPIMVTSSVPPMNPRPSLVAKPTERTPNSLTDGSSSNILNITDFPKFPSNETSDISNFLSVTDVNEGHFEFTNAVKEENVTTISPETTNSQSFNYIGSTTPTLVTSRTLPISTNSNKVVTPLSDSKPNFLTISNVSSITDHVPTSYFENTSTTSDEKVTRPSSIYESGFKNTSDTSETNNSPSFINISSTAPSSIALPATSSSTNSNLFSKPTELTPPDLSKVSSVTDLPISYFEYTMTTDKNVTTSPPTYETGLTNSYNSSQTMNSPSFNNISSTPPPSIASPATSFSTDYDFASESKERTPNDVSHETPNITKVSTDLPTSSFEYTTSNTDGNVTNSPSMHENVFEVSTDSSVTAPTLVSSPATSFSTNSTLVPNSTETILNVKTNQNNNISKGSTVNDLPMSSYEYATSTTDGNFTNSPSMHENGFETSTGSSVTNNSDSTTPNLVTSPPTSFNTDYNFASESTERTPNVLSTETPDVIKVSTDLPLSSFENTTSNTDSNATNSPSMHENGFETSTDSSVTNNSDSTAPTLVSSPAASYSANSNLVPTSTESILNVETNKNSNISKMSSVTDTPTSSFEYTKSTSYENATNVPLTYVNEQKHFTNISDINNTLTFNGNDSTLRNLGTESSLNRTSETANETTNLEFDKVTPTYENELKNLTNDEYTIKPGPMEVTDAIKQLIKENKEPLPLSSSPETSATTEMNSLSEKIDDLRATLSSRALDNKTISNVDENLPITLNYTQGTSPIPASTPFMHSSPVNPTNNEKIKNATESPSSIFNQTVSSPINDTSTNAELSAYFTEKQEILPYTNISDLIATFCNGTNLNESRLIEANITISNNSSNQQQINNSTYEWLCNQVSSSTTEHEYSDATRINLNYTLTSQQNNTEKLKTNSTTLMHDLEAAESPISTSSEINYFQNHTNKSHEFASTSIEGSSNTSTTIPIVINNSTEMVAESDYLPRNDTAQGIEEQQSEESKQATTTEAPNHTEILTTDPSEETTMQSIETESNLPVPTPTTERSETSAPTTSKPTSTTNTAEALLNSFLEGFNFLGG